MSRIVLNEHQTNYFRCPIGVKQGDCLSPTLFAIYINDLALELKDLGIGIEVNPDGEGSSILLNVLLYADDIVCLAINEEELQIMLFTVQEWCRKWRLEVNLLKTNVLHVRNARKRQSCYMFLFDKQPVPYCRSYKYLGMNIDEHLNFQLSVNKQTEGAERALSAVITKMIKNAGFPLSVYSMLYRSCVTSVADYTAPLTGYNEYDMPLKLQLRAIRAFLGVSKNAASAGVLSEVNWLLPKMRTRIIMTRQYHRLLNMDCTRLPKKVFKWDQRLNNENRISTWSNEIKEIFHESNLEMIYSNEYNFDLKFTIKYMEQEYLKKQAIQLREECMQLPKLRTFILFKNFNIEEVYPKKHLSFYNRRLLARMRLGCLPLHIETGRYEVPRLKEEDRLCKICQLCYCESVVESETHFLFQCPAYRIERDKWFHAMNLPLDFNTLTIGNKLSLIFNEPCNIKSTSAYIAGAFSARGEILGSL